MSIRLFGDVWPIDVDHVQFTDMGQKTQILCIANLENPIFPSGALPRPKERGTHAFSTNQKTLSTFINAFNPTCLSLANNHMMDYGELGLKETVEVCKRLGFITIGALGSILEARLPVVFEVDGKRIGVLGRCDNYFGIASNDRAGVAVLDPTIYSAIRKLKGEADIVVVSIHGGSQLCPWPSPHWQDTLRSLIDVGADIVHGHHAHIPKGYELYESGIIFYGLGNFLVNPDEWGGVPNHPHTLWSVMPECQHGTNGLSFQVKTTVTEKDPSGVTVRLSTDMEFQQHSAYLSKCNIPLGDRMLLTGLWQESAIRMYDLWFASWLGIHQTKLEMQQKALRARLSALKRGGQEAIFGRKSATRERELLIYYAFSCEEPRETISTSLGVLSGEVEDLRSDVTRRIVDEMMPWSVANVTEMKWPGPQPR